jgi:hypothetical protein
MVFALNDNKSMRVEIQAGRGTICPEFQHSGGSCGWISKFKASLIYKVSSRTVKAIQRNPVSKNQSINQSINQSMQVISIQGYERLNKI